MNKPAYIILHTAAHSGDSSAADIDEWHKERGWQKIGYHYVIRKDGMVEHGRDETEMGAHCIGWNSKSLGLCFSGHGDYQPWTVEQTDAGMTLIVSLCQKYALPATRVIGHRETGTKKTCPGNMIDMDQVRDEVARKLGGLAS